MALSTERGACCLLLWQPGVVVAVAGQGQEEASRGLLKVLKSELQSRRRERQAQLC